MTEVVVVDDFSKTSIETEIKEKAPSHAITNVTFIRHPENLGAGAARNNGLAQVSYPFVLFIDSDDQIGEAFEPVLESFMTFDGPFDFGMFRHVDTRELFWGRKQGLPVDEMNWQKLEPMDRPTLMTKKEHRMMAQVSAYPWNKLYRTEFLRAHKIRCTEIPVHNDIELHWSSFICADNVLYTHDIGLTHVVNDNGNRITNRKNSERLRVFEAMENVLKRFDNLQDSAATPQA